MTENTKVIVIREKDKKTFRSILKKLKVGPKLLLDLMQGELFFQISKDDNSFGFLLDDSEEVNFDAAVFVLHYIYYRETQTPIPTDYKTNASYSKKIIDNVGNQEYVIRIKT